MAVIVLNQKPKPSKKKYVKAQPVKDPKKIEWEARRSLFNISQPIKADIQSVLDQMRLNPTMQASEVGRQLERIKNLYQMQFEGISDEMAWEWVTKVNDWNRDKTLDTLRKALGIDVGTILTEDLQKDLNMMMYEASMYIKTIPSEMVRRVSERVLQHYKGIPMPENRTLAGQIKEEFRISDGRAKVLARDQTSKMNNAISAIRQKSVGIDKYIWETSMDRRVVGTPGGLYPKGTKLHKNHYVMEGILCRWDDPTVYSTDKGKTWIKRTEQMPKNHPGDDIMCRCRAAPYIDIEELKVKWAE